MNKIVMCLVFISCSSLFSMDSAITMKFLDDDGNVQAKKQVCTHLLKSKAKSEVSIPTSGIAVETSDEIQSLLTLWYSKENVQASRAAVYEKLAAKKLDEMVEILNSLEYLQEPDRNSVLFLAVSAVTSQIKRNKSLGHMSVLQDLKPRLSRLVVESLLSEFKPRPPNWIDLRIEIMINLGLVDDPERAVRFEFTAPEYVTIPQATVLLKIMKYDHNLQSFSLEGKKVNEKEIYKSLDQATRRKVGDYFDFSPDCTIL